MELCFLGTSGAIPAAEDGNVSFTVSADNTSVLVDLSGNPVQNLLRSGIDPLGLDAVLLTHAHPDHLYALPSLIQTLWLMKRRDPLILLSNAPTRRKAEELLILFNLADKKGMYELDWRTDSDTPMPIRSSLSVTLFPVEHSLPTSGVRVESDAGAGVYSSDTAPCSGVLEMARGCSTLIHEASGPASRREQLNEAGHSTGSQAGEIAARAGVGTLFLCHFDRSGDSLPEDMKSEAEKSFPGTIVIPVPFHRYRMQR